MITIPASRSTTSALRVAGRSVNPTPLIKKPSFHVNSYIRWEAVMLGERYSNRCGGANTLRSFAGTAEMTNECGQYSREGRVAHGLLVQFESPVSVVIPFEFEVSLEDGKHERSQGQRL